MYTGKKIYHYRKGKPEHKFDAAFKKKQAKVHINFSLEVGRLKIKKSMCACTESIDLICRP
jgi:hypothetical protein